MKTIPEALDQLPNTVDKVYTYLAQREAKGIPRVSCGCPLAVYLAAETGHFMVSVGVKYAFVGSAASPGSYLFELPPAARGFVERFDSDASSFPEVVL